MRKLILCFCVRVSSLRCFADICMQLTITFPYWPPAPAAGTSGDCELLMMPIIAAQKEEET